MLVLDLFCGMGGLSLGFKSLGFRVAGFDLDRHAVSTYAANVGPATRMNLADQIPPGRAACVIGGPPCRPWSPMNVRRRGRSHADYGLVQAFDAAVMAKLPSAFVLENVPRLRFDAPYHALMESLGSVYDIDEAIVSYGDWGAASRRKRLFAIGLRRDEGHRVAEVFKELDSLKTAPSTVRSAIERFSSGNARRDRDQEWSSLRTIEKYADKYATNRFGWYKLKWDEPAPSFGNVAKTYTLHPDAWNGDGHRVVTPREVMAILGFEDTFSFPDGVPRTAKYRMVADAVSPVFSRALATSLRRVLRWS